MVKLTTSQVQLLRNGLASVHREAFKTLSTAANNHDMPAVRRAMEAIEDSTYLLNVIRIDNVSVGM